MATRLFPSTTELVPVELKNFPAGRAPRLDLYHYVAGQAVLYCEANTVFGVDARRRLLDSRVTNLYIRLTNGNVAAGGSQLKTLLGLSDDELAPEVKSKLIYSHAMSAARLVFLTPATPQHLEAATDVVAAIAGRIAEVPECVASLVGTMRNDTVFSHSVNVCIYATALAHYLGSEGGDLVDLGMGAFLHDIGKARVPDVILNKPGALSADEWETMMRHPEMGLQVLGESASRLSPNVRTAIYEHHERLDGSGYPRRLAGSAINTVARLVALVDVYDALTSERPYRSASPPFAALRTIRDEMSGKLDRELFDCFVRLLGRTRGQTGWSAQPIERKERPA